MAEVRRFAAESAFNLQAAERAVGSVFAPWVSDLALLVDSVQTLRPPGAPADWLPGVVVRLPFSKAVCADGSSVCSQVLMALADSAMVLACSTAWNGYRPVHIIDQTTQFLRPVMFDVMADARVLRVVHNVVFGRVTLFGAIDRRPVAMVASAYSTS
jgi:acyl-coenzyme A thioesterase PaaI-like protein